MYLDLRQTSKTAFCKINLRLKIVSYLCKIIHLRCLTGLRTRFWISIEHCHKIRETTKCKK